MTSFQEYAILLDLHMEHMAGLTSKVELPPTPRGPDDDEEKSVTEVSSGS
jgi:hypothetical protein